MAKEQPKFLAVLPWLRLAKEIEVGPFIFWRWPEDGHKIYSLPKNRFGPTGIFKSPLTFPNL